MREWLNRAVSKTVEPLRVPWVRIPPSPPELKTIAGLYANSCELQIEVPEKAMLVHAINSDDPPGIEAYWHRRFEARRRNGEWFELTAQDVAAFKRCKFM